MSTAFNTLKSSKQRAVQLPPLPTPFLFLLPGPNTRAHATRTCDDTHTVSRCFPASSVTGMPTVSTTRPSASCSRSFWVPSGDLEVLVGLGERDKRGKGAGTTKAPTLCRSVEARL